MGSFVEACRTNDLESVKEELNLGLSTAAQNGSLEALEFLLNQPGVNVNTKVMRPQFGECTPVMIACAYEKPEVVRRLV